MHKHSMRVYHVSKAAFKVFVKCLPSFRPSLLTAIPPQPPNDTNNELWIWANYLHKRSKAEMCVVNQAQ